MIHFSPAKFFGLAVLAAILLMGCLPAHAQLVYNVNSTLDEVDSNLTDGVCLTLAGTCTLRAAVMQANRVIGVGAVIVLPAGTFGLTLTAGVGDEESFGDLDLNAPLSGTPRITIRGAGQALSIIDANGIDRVLEVQDTRTASISDVTIQGGFLTGQNNGGGILNRGLLSLERVRFRNNEAGRLGGALTSSGLATVALIHCTIIANRAPIVGGIYNGSLRMITIDRSTVSGNIALDHCGGFYSTGPSTIRNSLIAGNSAVNIGGGICYVGSQNHVLTNTSVSGNTASGNGGGIYLESGSAFVYNISVIGNYAGLSGGGIFVASGARFAVQNSLFARNTAGAGGFPGDCVGVMEAFGTNMLSSIGGCSSSNAPLVFFNGSSIGPLQDNGGPTLTHALLAGNQAIDAPSSAPCLDEVGALLPFDQRGAPRIFGARCDIGAFEFGSVVNLIFANGFE